MIDPHTRRFCIACSYNLHARWHNDALAIEGLPHICDIEGKPITDQLCQWHLAHFQQVAVYLTATTSEGKPQSVRIGMRARPEHEAGGDASRDDLTVLLECMERRLYLLNAQVNLGLLWDDVSEQPTVSLTEVIARATLFRAIDDYLNPKERRIEEPSMGDLLQIDADYDDDRISGEE